MIEEKDVEHIAMLADIGITKEELPGFTGQFNEILDYFDILDQVEMTGAWEQELANVFQGCRRWVLPCPAGDVSGIRHLLSR
jgi:aspartyl-tRNA(Asn)/glutamyl-tRNA(Gln) amidotransferase subunit C